MYKRVEYQMASSLLIQTGADRKISLPTKAVLVLTECDTFASLYSPLLQIMHTTDSRGSVRLPL